MKQFSSLPTVDKHVYKFKLWIMFHMKQKFIYKLHVFRAGLVFISHLQAGLVFFINRNTGL